MTKQIKGLNEVIVAIPDTQIDDLLIPVVRETGANLYRGQHHDVLGRYLGAARASNTDVIMRITADCPMLNPIVCERMLRKFVESPDVDYLSNCHPRTFPKGWDCEIFTRPLLEHAHKHALTPYQREHVTPWIYDSWHRPYVEIHNHEQDDDESDVNFSLDTIEDYVRIVSAMNARDAHRRAKLEAAE